MVGDRMSNFIITRDLDNASDELRHWKYIKREKGKNGKWRYIYNDSELKKYNKGIVETKEKNTATEQSKDTIKYQKSNNLFDKESYVKSESLVGKKKKNSYTTKSQGRISRAQAKGEKWIYNNFLK